MISISPFVSGVTDGYQRPAAMFGPRLQPLVCGVEQMRLDDALELRVLVAAGDEERTVEEVGETGAEDVETLIDSGRRMGARDRVVDGGSREVVNGKGLRRRIADGVPGEHFAVRKQSHVNANDGPVDDRSPLSDLSGIRGDFGGSGLRRPAGQEPRLPVELRLERSAVDDGVLGLMPRRGVDVVREHGPRGTERQCVR